MKPRLLPARGIFGHFESIVPAALARRAVLIVGRDQDQGMPVEGLESWKSR